MLLERTIAQLDIGDVPPHKASKMGQLGYLQWLGGLPDDASYPGEAARALSMARPFTASSPAVAVFCQILEASLTSPLAPLDVQVLRPTRRGGARARRDVF
jgi:hypothetical protein